MVNYSLPLYEHQPEIWDKNKCAKMAKRIARDGLGTPYPFKGYIGSEQTGYGTIRYNGGIVRDGKWWQGEHRPLPSVAPGFEIVRASPWGFRIVVA